MDRIQDGNARRTYGEAHHHGPGDDVANEDTARGDLQQ
jgi:hypothetical protein